MFFQIIFRCYFFLKMVILNPWYFIWVWADFGFYHRFWLSLLNSDYCVKLYSLKRVAYKIWGIYLLKIYKYKRQYVSIKNSILDYPAVTEWWKSSGYFGFVSLLTFQTDIKYCLWIQYKQYSQTALTFLSFNWPIKTK